MSKKTSHKQKVAVVGLGYVGLPLALLTKKNGYDCIGIDVSRSRVDAINNLTVDKNEPGVEALHETPINAYDNFDQINSVDISIIAVPTPVNGRTPDLTALKGATKSVAQRMQKGSLLIIESTINPGVCDDVIIPLAEEASGMKEGVDFYLSHCPERISPGDGWEVEDIARVLGSNTQEGLDRSKAFYDAILNAEVKPMNTIKEAEAVKVVENSFRDINIAFVNELAMSFHRMGINIENVIDGAATKPFGYMPFRPGPGVGGHCIPVDPYYLIEYARGFGFDHDFLRLARRINDGMPEFVVEVTQDQLNNAGLPMKGKKVCLLGIAYKPDINDARTSPARTVRDLLNEQGANVITFDPFMPNESDTATLEEALEGAAAVVIGTNHTVFNTIDAAQLKKHGVKVFIDGRNAFRDQADTFRAEGISYTGVGINQPK